MAEQSDSIRLSPAEAAVAGERAPAVLAGRRLLVAAQRLRYLLDQRLRSDGLTTQQAALLNVARDREGPTLAQAAEALGCSHQNIRQLVAPLVRKGLLAVEDDPTDRRARRLIALTAGQSLWDRRDDGDFDAVDRWFAVLDRLEQAELAELLGRLAAHLEAARTADA
jgi:DNA-binding MarR family transcriptional regulator